MRLLIDENKLQLLLEKKKEYIGKKVLWDSVLSAVSFLVSVALASYKDLLGIPGVVIKVAFVILGILFTIKSGCDVRKSYKEKYDYSNLLKDINDLNEITDDHSIVVIKDTFNDYSNRYLIYDDKQWNCEFFLNYNENPNNETFIKEHLSAELKIPLDDIKLTYITYKIHQKFSESAKKEKVYCHKFYRAEIQNFPECMKMMDFEIDGKSFHWKTISELESNENTMNKNNDIVGYVKALY